MGRTRAPASGNAAVELSKASLTRGESRTVARREECDQLVRDVTRPRHGADDCRASSRGWLPTLAAGDYAIVYLIDDDDVLLCGS